MARTFVSASSQRYARTSYPLTAPPFTLAAWCRPASFGSTRTVIALDSNSDANHRHFVYFDAAGQLSGQSFDGVTPGTMASGIASTGAWAHVCGVWTSTSSRALFLNGGTKGTNANTVSPTVDRFELGHCANFYFDGDICEAGVWDAALTDDEVAALGKGWCPLLIRPQSLRAYYPVMGSSPLLDRWKDSLDLTASGSPADAAHRPLIYPVGVHL